MSSMESYVITDPTDGEQKEIRRHPDSVPRKWPNLVIKKITTAPLKAKRQPKLSKWQNLPCAAERTIVWTADS